MNRFFTAIGSFFRHFSPAYKQAFAEALRIAEEVGPLLLANLQWSDDQRREAIVAAVKKEIGESHPQYAFIASVVIDVALKALRAQLRK